MGGPGGYAGHSMEWKNGDRKQKEEKDKKRERAETWERERSSGRAGWIKESAGFSTWRDIHAILDAAT